MILMPMDDHSRNTRRNNYVDLISSLPDEILQHILSFIPTKFAISTSILSKRWKKIWCETPCLSFYGSKLRADLINKTLIRYTATKIMNFHLSASLIANADQTDTLIEFAMSRNTEKMSLKFDMFGVDSGYIFPDFFYHNSFVKQLKLKLWPGAMTPRCNVSWTSLKSLSLLFKSLSDEYVAKILSGCPVLESLILSFHRQLRFLDLSKSPRLSRLDINCKDDLERNSTVIIAPYIHYLRLRNLEIPEIRFTLQDVSSLTEADLDLRSLSTKTSISMGNFQKMLAKLENIKELTLGANFLQLLSYAELHGVYFRTVNLETLTLEIVIFTSVLTGITRMLQTSPSLKRINIHIKKDNIWGQSLFRYLRSQGLNQDQSWKLKDGIYQTPLDNIPALMDLEKEAKFVFWLVEFLLGNTKTVETVVLLLGDLVSASNINKLLQVVPTLCGNNKVSIVLKR